MKSWAQIQKIYDNDKKIFEALGIILSESHGNLFTLASRQLMLPKADNITIYDIVLARQIFLNPDKGIEDIKVILHLLPNEDFERLAIEAVESLLDDFKRGSH